VQGSSEDLTSSRLKHINAESLASNVSATCITDSKSLSDDCTFNLISLREIKGRWRLLCIYATKM